MAQINHLIQAGAEEVGRLAQRRHLRKLPEMNTCLGENREKLYQRNTLLLNIISALRTNQVGLATKMKKSQFTDSPIMDALKRAVNSPGAVHDSLHTMDDIGQRTPPFDSRTTQGPPVIDGVLPVATMG